MGRLLCLIAVVTGIKSVAAPMPVKLGIVTQKHTIRSGESLQVQVELLSGNNQPAAAPRPLTISLQARLAAGSVDQLQTVQIPQNQSSAQVTITPPETGLVYLWAKNPQLLPGGVYIRVRGAKQTKNEQIPPPQTLPSARPSPPRTQQQQQQQPAPAGSPLQIALRYSPDRPILADGKDAASIEAFLLTDDAAANDIHLNVFDSSGSMQPMPLTIPKGQSSGRSTVTYGQPGAVTVEFFSSSPRAECEGDKKLSIKFVPPVTRLVLTSSPPGITLLDTAELFATLTDEQERPTATDTTREVVFGIESGRGQLGGTMVQIVAGQSQAHTTFQPERSGALTVSAATANLLTATAPIDVSVPFALLLCSALGGLVGGVISYWKNRKRSPARVAVGMVTGFIFYWACLFLGLASAGRGVMLNPLSAFALSTLGGWLQTEVFSALWSVMQPKQKAG
jgi:hypothetical protein